MRLLILLLIAASSWGQMLQAVVGTKKPAAAGGGPITITQSCLGGSYYADASCVMGSSVTAGKVLVAWQGGGATPGAPSGCASSWTLLASDSGAKENIYTATATGGACTVTGPNNSEALVIIVHELSASSVTSDATPVFAGLSACSNCSSPSITPASDGVLVIAWAHHSDTYTSTTAPYTNVINGIIPNWGAYALAGKYWQTTAAATSMSFVITYGFGATAIAAFR